MTSFLLCLLLVPAKPKPSEVTITYRDSASVVLRVYKKTTIEYGSLNWMQKEAVRHKPKGAVKYDACVRLQDRAIDVPTYLSTGGVLP